jgi:hypothetical protein
MIYLADINVLLRFSRYDDPSYQSESRMDADFMYGADFTSSAPPVAPLGLGFCCHSFSFYKHSAPLVLKRCVNRPLYNKHFVPGESAEYHTCILPRAFGVDSRD